MLEITTEVLVAAAQVMASEGDDDARSIGLVFLLAGPIFYWVIYMRYRNSDKRHHHELETEAKIHDLQQTDEFVQARKGLTSSSMKGANYKDVRGSVR
jgi:hypothetical protein